MPALICGTLCGLLCAGLALWTGSDVWLAVLLHMLGGGLATFGIAWLQFSGHPPDDTYISEPHPVA